MINPFNKPPFSTIKKKIENAFTDSQDAVYRQALASLLAFGLSTSAMASQPDIQSKDKKITSTESIAPDWRKELIAKKDSLAHEITAYEQDLLDRTSKGNPYETKKIADENGKSFVVKSFRVSAPEGRETGSRVDITYSENPTGESKPMAIAITEYDSKSGQQITLTDGAYNRGITGEANHFKTVDSRGGNEATIGFTDSDKDGQYNVLGTAHPVGEFETLRAYLNVQVLYDRCLKDVLHVPHPVKQAPVPEKQKTHPDPLKNGLLSQNIDN